MTERHVQQLGENISDVSPVTYVAWLQYFNSATHQSLQWGNFLASCPLANQDIYPPGIIATVYSESLEVVFEFPGEITLPEHVRKGPPPTVLEEKNPSYQISCYLEKKRWKSRKIREVSPIAQLGIKREHSESLLQDLVKLFPGKHQLMIGSYIVYFHQQRC